jgi:peptidyl-prolyl cis-trans isomerase B (cyclophilin B)
MFRPRFVIGLVVVAATMAGGVLYAQTKGKAKAAEPPAPTGPVIVMELAGGNVEIELSEAEAPQSVAHVLDLVRHGFYRGQRVWWATPALLQFGDPQTRDMTKQEQWGTVGSGRPVGVDESKLAKHKFVRGTVGLGYKQGYDPKTADSYIVIIKGANPAMDGKYAVIGHVSDGMALVDKLEKTDLIKNMYVKGEKK